MPVRFVSLVVVMFICTFVIGLFVLYLTKKYETKAMKAKTARDAYAAKLIAELEAAKAAGETQAEELKKIVNNDSTPVADG